MKLWKRLRNKIRNPKPKWASLCREVYVDDDGYRYYQYIDELDIGIYRKGELDKCFMELRYGIDRSDLINGIKLALSEPETIKNKGAIVRTGLIKPNLVQVGYFVQEFIDRDELLIVPDILFSLCANMLIREDEDPDKVDQEILEKKIATFKAEIGRGGLHDFFQRNGWLQSAGLSNISQIEFSRLMSDSENRTNRLRAHLQRYISEQKSHDIYSSKPSII